MMDFNRHDGFEIISRMINTSRRKINNNSFFFLLWGYTILAGSTLQYLLIRLGHPKHYLPWPPLTTAATIIHILYGYRMHKQVSTKTYLDDVLIILWLCTWGAMCLGFGLAVYMAGFPVAYMVLILLLGMGTFITGMLIRFRPLIFGAAVAWLCCINLAFVAFPDTLLLLGVAIIFCYIIPGHILKRKNRNVV